MIHKSRSSPVRSLKKPGKEETPIREFQLKNNFICLTVWYSVAIVKTEYKKEKLCSAHYIREDYLIKTVLDQITFLQEKFSEGKIEFRRFIYSAINHRTSEHIRQVNSRIKAIQERLNQIRTTETKMYEDKLMGKVDEETFHNITHVLNNEARNLTDENSQLLVILDKVEDLKMGIDNFVQKIERFANCTVTENDRVIMEQLIDHIEVYENDSNEISVRIFFADIGVIE